MVVLQLMSRILKRFNSFFPIWRSPSTLYFPPYTLERKKPAFLFCSIISENSCEYLEFPLRGFPFSPFLLITNFVGSIHLYVERALCPFRFHLTFWRDIYFSFFFFFYASNFLTYLVDAASGGGGWEIKNKEIVCVLFFSCGAIGEKELILLK